MRQRGAKAGVGPNRIKLCRKDSTEMLPGRDEGETPLACGHAHLSPTADVTNKLCVLIADVAMKMAPTITDQTSEKSKKRYRKKKTKLEETFPSYLQVTLALSLSLSLSRSRSHSLSHSHTHTQ